MIALVKPGARVRIDFCEVSGNRKLLGLVTDLAGEVHTVIALIGQLYDEPARTAETHTPLLEALATRDRDRLRAEVDHRIRVTLREMRAFFTARGAPATRAG